jgi:K+-transporting ATPase c subunit
MTTINYTPEMVATLAANAPLDYTKAQALGKEMGRSAKSIIAKAKREGIEYVSKAAPARKKSAPTKADIVSAICSGLDIDDLAGLEKATGSALSKLLSAIK